jgi:hypothetical protein
MIAPTVALAGTDRRAAIEGGIAPIPRDIAESRARWRVLVHIVDPLLEEAAIYTSLPAEFQTVS